MNGAHGSEGVVSATCPPGSPVKLRKSIILRRRKDLGITASMPNISLESDSPSIPPPFLKRTSNEIMSLPSYRNSLSNLSPISNAEKKQKKKDDNPSLKDMFAASAKSLKKAFPTYKSLTLGDITIGLASVAVEHKKKHVAQNYRESPVLFEPIESDYDYGFEKVVESSTINPDRIDHEKFILAEKLLPYSNMVYYPIITTNWNSHVVLMESTDESLISAESITKNKDHRKLKAQPIDNVLRYVNESLHMRQVYFAKIDEELNALIIAVRGTDSNMVRFFLCLFINLTRIYSQILHVTLFHCRYINIILIMQMMTILLLEPFMVEKLEVLCGY